MASTKALCNTMLASNERRVGKNAVQDQQYSPAVEINLGTGSRKVRARLKASQGKTEYSEIKHIGSDMCSDCMDEDRNEWTSKIGRASCRERVSPRV